MNITTSNDMAEFLMELAHTHGGGSLEIASAIAPHLVAGFPTAEITGLRAAAFLAQTGVETAYFSRLQESLSYTAKRIPEVWRHLAARADELAGNPIALGNAAYAGKNGNGDEASGDGYRYRGRGLLQTTGRANYRVIGYEDKPDMVAEPEIAVKSALAFWEHHLLNEAADKEETGTITLRINGAFSALTEREALYEQAKKLLGL